jgi:hypothetical protein
MTVFCTTKKNHQFIVIKVTTFQGLNVIRALVTILLSCSFYVTDITLVKQFVANEFITSCKVVTIPCIQQTKQNCNKECSVNDAILL